MALVAIQDMVTSEFRKFMPTPRPGLWVSVRRWKTPVGLLVDPLTAELLVWLDSTGKLEDMMSTWMCEREDDWTPEDTETNRSTSAPEMATGTTTIVTG